MPLNGRLTVVEEVDGSWRLSLTRPESAAVTGRLGPETAAALVALAGGLPTVAKEVLTARSHAAWTASETAFGRALAAALCEQGELWGAVSELVGQALAMGDEVLLAVEAEGEGPRGLPWELLHASPEGQLMSGVRPVTVARLVPSGAASAPISGQRLRLVLWAPEADDDLVGRVIATRQDLADELGISSVVVASPDEPMPPASPGEVDVLHLLCHGARAAELLGPLVGAPPMSEGEPARGLVEAARASALVVVEVCEGAASVLEPRAGLADALVGAGAGAVVCPIRPVGSGALDAFVRPLISCLHRGESLARAMRSGHAAVSALGLAHPANRWWILQLALGRMDAAGPRVRRSVWPDSLPLPAADVLLLLEAAANLSKAAGHGFVGVEHLALALDERLASSPLSQRALALLEPQRAEIRAHLVALSAADEVPDRLPLTPRLLRIGRQLSVGFDLDALWRALAAERFCPLLGLSRLEPAPVAEGALADAGPTTVSLEPPDRVEVVGGPEDGRVLPFLINTLLGRWHASPDTPTVGLYQGTPLTDTRLSRDAVRWTEPGKALLKRPATRRRWGRSSPLAAGEVVVADGDVLALTAATRLAFFKSVG